MGVGFTLGLGAMTAMYAGWSLIARDPTRDHWAMSVVGLVLAIAPWIGGYAGDAAAWVSWLGGAGLMLLAGAAYIADEQNEVNSGPNGSSPSSSIESGTAQCRVARESSPMLCRPSPVTAPTTNAICADGAAAAVD